MDNLVQIRRSIAMVSLAATLVIGGALTWWIASSRYTVFGLNTAVTLKVTSISAPAGAANLSEGFSSVVEPLLPTVVNISTHEAGNRPLLLLVIRGGNMQYVVISPRYI